MKLLVKEHPDALNRHRFISIVETPDLRFLQQKSPREITLSFADIDPDDRFFSSSEEEDYVLFDDKHADAIIDFLIDAITEPESEMLFVNCMAGISRSGAVITFVSDILDIPQMKVMHDNPDIMPNPFVLKTLKRRWRERKLDAANLRRK